jgi:hypothetical protein
LIVAFHNDVPLIAYVSAICVIYAFQISADDSTPLHPVANLGFIILLHFTQASVT